MTASVDILAFHPALRHPSTFSRSMNRRSIAVGSVFGENRASNACLELL
jgi:hypothetical protein